MLGQCPVAMQNTGYLGVDRKTRVPEPLVKGNITSWNNFFYEKSSFRRVPSQADKHFMDGSDMTGQANWCCETNISFCPHPKSSTYHKQLTFIASPLPMLESEESTGTHHLLMAWEERLLHKGEFLRTQWAEDFNELRKLRVDRRRQKKTRHSGCQWLIV